MLKRSRWLLLKRPEKLTGEQRGRLAELVRRNLRTVRAYLLKEDFQSLWGYVSPYWAGQFLDRWCTRTMRSRLDPMKEVARMVALAPRPDSELVPSPGAVLQWRCRRLQRKGQSDHQTGVWVPHLRGTGSRFVSRTWRPARTKTHPQILLTRRVPKRAGPLFEELCSGNWWKQPAAGELLRRTEHKGQRGELATMFAATLRVYEDDWDTALRTSIEGWWSGEKLRVADVRDALKRMQRHRDVPCQGAKAHELPGQRTRFATDFVRARHRGWVLLLDELELIGQYSRLQRARSYAALARWMGIEQSAPAPEIVVVGAITDDYAAAKIGPEEGAGDRIDANATLADRPRHKHLRDACEAGMRFIERNCIELGESDEERNRDILERLRNIYSRAYDWETPPATPLRHAAESWMKMRHRIRAPIEEWDLLRLDPETTPYIIAEEERADYTERPELEKEASEE